MNCPHCGKDIPEEASFCLACYRRINSPEPAELAPSAKSAKKAPVAAVSLAVIALAAFIVLITSDKPDAPKPQTVSHSGAPISVSAEPSTAETEKTKETATASPPSTEAESKTETTTSVSTEPATEAQTTTAPASETTEKTTEKKTAEKTANTTKATTKAPKATVPEEVTIKNGVLLAYPSGATASSYTVPYSVTKIAPGAFAKNKYLKTIKFSKREEVECDYSGLVSDLPKLKTVYIYPGTTADLNINCFNGKKVVYYD